MTKLRTTLAASICMLCMVVAACDGGQSAPAVTTAPDTELRETSSQLADIAPRSLEVWSGKEDNAPAFDHCAVDLLNGEKSVGGVFTAGSAVTATFEGWVATPGLDDPGQFTLYLQGMGGSYKIPATTGLSRKDVADVMKRPALENSGFSVSIAPANLPRGEYTLLMGVSHLDVQHYCDPHQKLRME